MNHNVEIPEEIWADFVNVLFAADRRVVRTPENEKVMDYIKYIILQAFQDETVLIINGKIVPRERSGEGEEN
jgi:sulfur carrier protein ThiS